MLLVELENHFGDVYPKEMVEIRAISVPFESFSSSITTDSTAQMIVFCGDIPYIGSSPLNIPA